MMMRAEDYMEVHHRIHLLLCIRISNTNWRLHIYSLLLSSVQQLSSCLASSSIYI